MVHVDLWEGFNGTCQIAIGKGDSSCYARLTDRPQIADDDSHGIDGMGHGYTLVFAKPTEESVIDAIREGRIRAVPFDGPVSTPRKS